MRKVVYNFSPGPGMLPEEVLTASAAALVDYQGSGIGIGEYSHRGKEFDAVRIECEKRIRALMGIGDDYAVLFLQGGATQHFEMIPMNFLKGFAEYVVAGEWGKKAAAAGKRYGDARVIGSSEDLKFTALPTGWKASPEADYLHICSNNTIYGTRSSIFPDHPRLIADMSSEIMSRTVDLKRFAMIYAGAQKNLGIAGVVLCLVRKDLLTRCPEKLPPIFSYAKALENESCLNTPPTFAIYVLLETMKWIERQGGIAAIEQRNEQKAAMLYAAIDGSNGYYKGTVTDLPNRSRMNVTYVLPNEDLTKKFLAGAEKEGLMALKGYRSVGGIRASIYNAMPVAGVAKLVEYMKSFQKANAL